MSTHLKEQQSSFIMVQKQIKVPLSEIIFLQAEQNYTHAHLKNGTKITIAKTLREFEIVLSNDSFFRIHRAFLVNKSHLKGINSVLGEAILTNNHRVVASRRRKSIFNDMIN